MTLAEDTQVITSSTVRRFVRRSLFWIGLATVILILAVVVLGAAHVAGKQPALSPTDASPTGTKALVEVLREHGVNVTITSSLDDTSSAVNDPYQTTLVINDADDILDDSQLAEASSFTANLVLIDPSFSSLQALAPGVAHAGTVTGTATADCAVAAVQKAGEVTVTGTGFRLTPLKTIDTTATPTPRTPCLLSGKNVYSLIQFQNDLSSQSGVPQGTTTVLGTTDALSNQYIVEHGNAALALNLLGEKRNLVWYVPGPLDVSGDTLPSLAELSPGWVTQVTLLLLVATIFAALWRGRRLGPLIVENLPVTVRASETMFGRARLYENASARLHTLDSLRIGTVDRLASACGLPSVASVTEVADAAAALTQRNPASVRGLLFDARPANDRQLIELSDELLSLEKDVASAIRPH